jgi:hypothetical protein
LREGNVRLAHFTDAGTRDPELLEIMAGVAYEVHPDLTGYETFLEREFTDVHLDLSDGSTLSRRVQRIDNKGSRGRPLSYGELEEKFLDCARGYGDFEGAKKAFRLIAVIETLSDIGEVTACLN